MSTVMNPGHTIISSKGPGADQENLTTTVFGSSVARKHALRSEELQLILTRNW